MTHVLFSRIVIETTSPMAINTGARETGFDTQLARDANGLPCIPATSLAGVWRHICASVHGEDESLFWFGYVQQTENMHSLISISNGVLHDQHNKPVKGLKSLSEIENDPLLRELKREQPLHREHVRINDRGVAAHEAKFDQTLLPTGARFTIELRLQTEDFDNTFEQRWKRLIALWNDRRFALGASTRNGLGQFKVISTEQCLVDLRQGTSVSKLINDWRNGIAGAGEALRLPDTETTHTKLIAELSIQALDNWRSGAGSQPLNNTTDTSVDMITYSERSIEWGNHQGIFSQRAQPILAGSTIKGILAHRIAFHYHRHTQQWAEKFALAGQDFWVQRPAALDTLLGFVDPDNHESSIAGKLFVDDAVVEFEDTITRTHNSIDRFTGGVCKGALYSEELLYRPSMTIRIWAVANLSIDPVLKTAFIDTLNDLENGLLPFGAGAGRGNSLVERNPEGVWNMDFSWVGESAHQAQEVTG